MAISTWHMTYAPDFGAARAAQSSQPHLCGLTMLQEIPQQLRGFDVNYHHCPFGIK